MNGFELLKLSRQGELNKSIAKHDPVMESEYVRNRTTKPGEEKFCRMVAAVVDVELKGGQSGKLQVRCVSWKLV